VGSPSLHLALGWTYKFEAYTPPARRQFGYVAGAAPKTAAFRNALDEELRRMALFLSPP